MTYKKNNLTDFSVKTFLCSKKHIMNPLGLIFSLIFSSSVRLFTCLLVVVHFKLSNLFFMKDSKEKSLGDLCLTD